MNKVELSRNSDNPTCMFEMWKISDIDKLCCNKENETISEDKVLRIMMKMGYKCGSGLGKYEQGIVEPIEVRFHVGKRGLGSETNNADEKEWTDGRDNFSSHEDLIWLQNNSHKELNYETLRLWMITEPKKLNVEDETNFCDSSLLRDILKAKAGLEKLDQMELLKARSRANPFETIKSVFFMNRAALKMANIDACTDFMFTNIDKNPHHKKKDGPFYFADVCAGPGGFSEYILWRKEWLFKGFGFTLKGDNDFKLSESTCASSVTFNSFYGVTDDGNVCNPENIKDFAGRVMNETENKGVHFMMSDGGFSVDGNENLQEVLSKQLYLCQCLVALEIVRPNGHFVSKLFDVFTPFSVGLIYLLYQCFEKFTILKPNSSRPANSERYLICNRLKNTKRTAVIRKYLRKLVEEFWNLKQLNGNIDMTQIVPLEVMRRNSEFSQFIIATNNRLGLRQYVNLLKLAAFYKNPNLLEPKQEQMRMDCLFYWRIPDRQKISHSALTVDDLLAVTVYKPEFMLVQPKYVTQKEELFKPLNDIKDWHFGLMSCGKSTNNCNFYAGVGGSKVYRLQKHKWVKVKNMQLVEGTLLYGEMVKEHSLMKDCECFENKSLHVIDALRLGNTRLADFSFTERLVLIETYCRAVNFETKQNSIRIRPKPIKPLDSITVNSPVKYNVSENKYFTLLPKIGIESFREYFIVNSILLLKTGENQSFYSTYVLRVPILISETSDENGGKCLSLTDFLNFLGENL